MIHNALRHFMQYAFAPLLTLYIISASTSATVAADKLYALVICDTLDENIGPSDKADLDNVSQTLKSMVPQQMLELRTLDKRRVSHQRIMKAVKAVRPDSTDAFFVYYSGHGGFDTRRNDHFCALPSSERLYRSELRAAVTRSGARLSVLITDTCSSMVTPRAAPSSAVPEFNTLPILLRALFFDSSGVVDISATKPGETAIGLPRIGGCFTYSLMAVLQTNAEQALTWDAVLRQARDQAKQMNRGQTAYALSELPVPNGGTNADGRIRFGVVADRTRRSAAFNGVEVQRVFDGYPATRIRAADGQTYSLVPGLHVITHVNDTDVPTNDDLVREVNAAGDIMTIRVRGLRTGRADEYTVDLRGSGGQRVRLGAFAEATAFGRKFGGLQVLAVSAGYPATRLSQSQNGGRYTLVPYRDIIMSVNGVRPSSADEFRSAILNSPRVATFEVYNSMTDTTASYRTELMD
jgi:hypothetical protein